MDTIIEKKPLGRKAIQRIVIALIIIIAIVSASLYTMHSAQTKVSADRVTISEVVQGTFQEYIPLTGVVMPVTTIYLDALEGGRVEQKFVEDGAMVKKGQPLLRLSNTDLALSLVNQETSVYNLLTQMQISRNAAVQNTVNKLNQLADVESQLKEAKRIYDLDKHLYQEKAIGLQEFKQAENNYLYYNEKMKLSKQILEQDSVFNQQQLQQSRQSYEGSQNALNVMRKKVGDLIVRAPIDGQLTALDVEIGQNKRQGERLGQVDAVNGFKVRADVDEHYISRVYNGLKAICTVAGKNYTLNITKVFAQVVSGKFQVDMQFKDSIPDGIKRGQTLQIQLILGDAIPSVLLPKGSFSQQTGGNWVYVLNKNGNQAYKKEVQLGMQNPDYYQVIKGLQPGEKVITSSYESFNNASTIDIIN